MPPVYPPKDVTQTKGEPHDRLTRICDRLSTAFDADSEKCEGDKLIIFIDSDADKRSGIVVHDWEETGNAVAALLVHLQAMFKAMGKNIIIAPLQNQRGN